MKIDKIVIYAEVNGKTCLVRNNAPVDYLLSVIQAFSKTGSVEVIPLKNQKIVKFDYLEIDKDFNPEEQKGR